MKTNKTILTVLFVFTAGLCNAQEALCSGGGEARGSGTMSYSVGLPFYEGGTITAGVQHAYKITELKTSISDVFSAVDITVYPNPVTDKVIMCMTSQMFNGMCYIVTDNNGRTVKSALIESDITEINMSNLATNIYFLQVYSGNRRVKTFKILKIK
ncbi:MAG: T9SS type A sorting domain-containing protein [Bacteroidales bacterium]|nr:T9SS type A sorting domain-containing protein [Bacteroidales bacterium]